MTDRAMTPAERQAKYIKNRTKKIKKAAYMRQYMRDYRRARRNRKELMGC